MPCSKVERPRLDQPFVTGSIDTFDGPVPVVPAQLTWRDRFGGYAVRWKIGRYDYTVDPGLYAMGAPTDRSPVLVSANYKLSFDALRRHLGGRDVWILVLDTRGINVWCAAGKGTFGTEELVSRAASTDVATHASRGVMIVPQLGAPGVSLPEVKRRVPMRSIFGPVFAADLPAFLDANLRATPEMRLVTFPLRDRLALVPVEFVGAAGIAVAIVAGAAVAGGIGVGGWTATLASARMPLAIAAPLLTLLAGAVLTPALLPLLPFRMFSAKGALVGLVAGGVLAAAFGTSAGALGLAGAWLLAVAGSSFIAMNFTGTSTFTSLSGVESEMRRWMPLQIAGAVLAVALWIAGGWY